MSAAVPLVASLATSSTSAATTASAVAATAAKAVASAVMGSSATTATSSSSSGAAASVRLRELTLNCGEGLQLAAQSYVPASSSSTTNDDNNITTIPLRKILCLHGWMDNCRTFHHLAPLLTAQLNAHVVALDLPGHGLSGHKPRDSPPTVLAEAAYYVHEAVRVLDWPKGFCVVGHSMGAAVGSLYASAFPEYVSHLVLLDGAGPLARNPTDIAKHVRMHVERRQLAASPSQLNRAPRVYETVEHAVQARMATARTFPGNQYLSHGAALELVRRGTLPATSSSTTSVPAEARKGFPSSTTIQDDSGPVQFTHDPRLSWPSAQYFTEEQNEGIYKSIQCPVAFLRAEHGWPFEEAKAKRFLELLQPSLNVTLPGSHHFHADPDSAPAVAQTVIEWLQSEME